MVLSSSSFYPMDKERDRFCASHFLRQPRSSAVRQEQFGCGLEFFVGGKRKNEAEIKFF